MKRKVVGGDLYDPLEMEEEWEGRPQQVVCLQLKKKKYLPCMYIIIYLMFERLFVNLLQ